MFQVPEGSVLITWKPGDYDHVYFMFVPQLRPHQDQFNIHDWSMIVFSEELSAAIKRIFEDPPAVNETPDEQNVHPEPDEHMKDMAQVAVAFVPQRLLSIKPFCGLAKITDFWKKIINGW